MTFLFKILLSVFIAAVFLSLPRWILSTYYADRIHTPEEANSMPTAIVFGAGLRRDGRPTAVLADRISTASALYQLGKVEKLLMSGSINAAGYDESAAMFEYAVELGVPQEDIIVDPGGNRTYLTCARAKDLYGVDRALLVTQRYHLPRALILCDTLSIESEGIAADLRSYSAQGFWNAREVGATYRALWEAGKMKSAILWDKLLNKEPS